MTLIKSISGIRGTIGGLPSEGLTPIDIVKFSAAFGIWLKTKTKKRKIVIGRDARISGTMVQNIVSGTLLGLGFDVIDLDLATTPTVEMAVPNEKAAGGIIITASHNPKHWNALKLLNSSGEFISGEDGMRVLKIAENENFEFASVDKIGKYIKNSEYLNWHIDKIIELPLVNRDLIEKANLRIVVDAVNSVGGIAVPALLRKLGVQDIEIFCEPTGEFPHNPEPLPDNLTELANTVKKKKAHLGIAVDPDVDRLVFVCEDGSMFGEEYTLVAIADYVLQNHKKGKTVSNLSSTKALKDITLKRGGVHYQSAVGEVHVVEMMKEVKAVIGGEGNGGVIYPELHYGRDALVGIALFLSYLINNKQTASMLRNKYPNYHISKNKIELTPEIDIDSVLLKLKEKYKKQPLSTIDGIRIEFEEDWVHLRKSNTEPIIRIYAESSNKVTANNISKQIMADLKYFSQNGH